MSTSHETAYASDSADETNAASSARALDILVVDDEPRIRDMLARALERTGHRVQTASGAEKAVSVAEKEVFDLIFLDLRLPDGSGLDLIPKLTTLLPEVQVVVITAHASVDSAVTAMRRGATDYLPKPFSPEQVQAAIHKTEQVRSLEDRVQTLERDVENTRPSAMLKLRSPQMSELVETASRVAETDASVLLRGESGTGKGVLARSIHARSTRSEEPFVVVHAPSLSRELFESELFGHVKGAFTGAGEGRPGRVDQAKEGTLFLDEIAELPTDLQPKLLRFLQEGEYERVGDPTTRRADVRLLAATNHDLEEAVERGSFRQDLLYRLNVIELEIPPLRSRPSDLLPLAHRFLDFFSDKYNRSVEGFTADVEQSLRRYSWPGNVRELKNVVERAVILSDKSVISTDVLTLTPAKGIGEEPLEVGQHVSLDRIEEAHIREVVEASDTLKEAAEILKIDPSTLWRRRKRYGLDPGE